jgi:hypothetical protein
MTTALLIAGMALLVYTVRTIHYRQTFGRWAWGRLRPDERRRLLPHDPRLAYERGYHDGVQARQAKEKTR